YTASDGTATSNTVNLTITIDGKNEPPNTGHDNNWAVDDWGQNPDGTGNGLQTLVHSGAPWSSCSDVADSAVDVELRRVNAVHRSRAHLGRAVARSYGTRTLNKHSSYRYTVNDATATTNAYALSLHDALPISYTASDGTATSNTVNLTIT